MGQLLFISSWGWRPDEYGWEFIVGWLAINNKNKISLTCDMKRPLRKVSLFLNPSSIIHIVLCIGKHHKGLLFTFLNIVASEFLFFSIPWAYFNMLKNCLNMFLFLIMVHWCRKGDFPYSAWLNIFYYITTFLPCARFLN